MKESRFDGKIHKEARMAEILRGKPVAEQLIFRLQERTARLKEAGIVPTAAIIRFGSNSDDLGI